MNQHIWWYLARSSGIAAMVLLVLSAVWGVLLATRVLRPIDRPAWLLDLHRWLGSLAVFTVALHLLGLVMDSYISFGWADLLVPGASQYRPVGVAVGVLALYGLIAVQTSSWLRRHLPRLVWQRIHYVSYFTLWASVMHAGMTGTDVINRAYQTMAIALAMVSVVAVTIRLLQPPGGGRGTRQPDLAPVRGE